MSTSLMRSCLQVLPWLTTGLLWLTARHTWCRYTVLPWLTAGLGAVELCPLQQTCAAPLFACGMRLCREGMAAGLRAGGMRARQGRLLQSSASAAAALCAMIGIGLVRAVDVQACASTAARAPGWMHVLSGPRWLHLFKGPPAGRAVPGTRTICLSTCLGMAGSPGALGLLSLRHLTPGRG